MYEGGGEEHVNSDTTLPSCEWASQQPPEEDQARGLSDSGASSDTLPRKGLTAPRRSPEKHEPDAEAHMLVCAAERSAPAGAKGRTEAGIRPDITPFKKHHSTRLCSAPVAPLS